MNTFTRIAVCLIASSTSAFTLPPDLRGAPTTLAGRSPGGDASRDERHATTRPTVSLPRVAPADMALLVQIARRALTDKLMKREEKGPIYRPPSLRGVRAMLHVTLRRDGAVLAEAETREMDVIDAAVAAGALLGRTVLAKEKLRDRPDIRSGGEKLGLELEWIGPAEELEASLEDETLWSEALLHSFEGGAEGIGVMFGGKVGRVRPGTVVARNYTPDLALLAAEEQVGLTALDKRRRPDAFRYFRFRSYHLWQPDARRRQPYLLVRGDTTIDRDEVTAGGLDATIVRLADYLRYRQNQNGWFSYQFAPSRDRYLDGDSATAQLHALHALAKYASWSMRPEFVADSGRGIQAAGIKLMEVRRKADPADDGGRPTSRPAIIADDSARIVLHFEGYGREMEVSARYLLALLAYADHAGVRGDKGDGLDDERAGLLRTLMASQEENGRLHLKLQAGEPETDTDAAAGWGLLAVSESARWRPDSRIEHVLHRALSYYEKRVMLSDDLEQKRAAGPIACAALVRAFASGYARTNSAEMSDFAFGLVDQFVGLQLNRENCPWPELRGAVNVRRRGAVGADTASYLTALADGLALAQRVGDEARLKRYRESVRSAARFVMQLEVRQPGCFYIRSPRDVLGGIRTALWDNQIRIDHCAEALLALIRAREVLYGPPTLSSEDPVSQSE
ncbi:MAG: hypothetical protein O7B26_06290 [Planctomycetota bacterium]|nr:hypothetical protein [Planctomycetota bacterium]